MLSPKASVIHSQTFRNNGDSGTLLIFVTSNSMKAMTAPGFRCEARRRKVTEGSIKYGKTKRPTKAS